MLIIVAFIIGESSMSTASAFASDLAMKRSSLRLHMPPADEGSSARWLINGFPATILIWTAEEWEKLTVRPSDAQYYPCGVWCALRME